MLGSKKKRGKVSRIKKAVSRSTGRRKSRRMMNKAEAELGWKEAKQRRWFKRTLMRKQSGVCAICLTQMGLKSRTPNEATLDHIIPKAKGGLTVITNLQLAHRSCNEAKGSDDAEV